MEENPEVLSWGRKWVMDGSKVLGPESRHQFSFYCDFLAYNPMEFESSKFKPGFPDH